jgi:hypothetical protein
LLPFPGNVDFITDHVYRKEISVSFVDVSNLTNDTLYQLDPLLKEIKAELLLENYQAGHHLVLCTIEKAKLILKAVSTGSTNRI